MKEATCNSWVILQFHEAQLAHLGLAKEQPRSAWEGAGRQSLIMIGRTRQQRAQPAGLSLQKLSALAIVSKPFVKPSKAC